jgi:hypothetical protein
MFTDWAKRVTRKLLDSQISDHARTQLTHLDQLLEALEANDHNEAARIFLSWGDVNEILSRVPDEAKPYIPTIMPYAMKAVDTVIPEEAIQIMLDFMGIDYEEPEPSAPVEVDEEGEPVTPEPPDEDDE